MVRKWLWLLNKRLYKKAVFLVILAMIPILVLLLGIVSQQESGFLRIVLCAQGETDPTAEAIFADLDTGSKLIVFTRCATAAEAFTLVQTGQADAAWIFPENLTQAIDAFSKWNVDRAPIVTVVQREETVPLRLSHEKLTGAVFKHCAKVQYIDFVRTNLPQLEGLTDEELMAHYNAVMVGENLFAFEAADADAPPVSAGYLLAPVRGLLSIVVLLCGLAAALFYMQDAQNGTFAWVPTAKRPLVALACEGIAVLNVATVMLAALYADRLGGAVLREVAALLLYALCCSIYCMLLQQLTGSMKVLCSLTPLLIVVMIAVCPVFFDLRSLAPLGLLFPPTYYLRAIYSNRYFLYMALYTLGLGALYLIARRVLRKRQ